MTKDKIVKDLENLKYISNEIKTPDYLEAHLMETLREKKKKNRIISSGYHKIAAVLICIFLLSYNFDALAYYSKKLTNYEDLSTHSVNQLIKDGEGQMIDSSFVFSDGNVLTLEGIMLDESQLIAFYSLQFNNGDTITPDYFDYLKTAKIKGYLFDYEFHGGSGLLEEDQNKILLQYEYDTPMFFEKYMTFTAFYSPTNETAKISFELDRSKALKTIYKSKINKSVEAENKEVIISDIVATQTKTVVNGQIQTIIELIIDVLNTTRMRPQEINISLIADGYSLSTLGRGISSDRKGITFDVEFEAIPENTKALDIVINEIVADYDIDVSIPMDYDIKEQDYYIHGEKITIDYIEKKNNKTYITFTSLHTTFLSNVVMVSDNQTFQLNNTNDVDYIKNDIGEFLHQRTMVFDNTVEEWQLNIQSISHLTKIDKTINVYK